MYETLGGFSRRDPDQRTASHGRLRLLDYFAAVGILICVVSGCYPDQVTVWSTQARSPDGQWIATGLSDQSSGLGNAAIISGVYLRRGEGSGPEQPLLHFLDDHPPGKGGINMTIVWLTPVHLQVSFDGPPKLNLLVVKYAGIEISVDGAE
jgi:hypothetical protein